MQNIETTVRDWECLKYCQTQENCYVACGLERPEKTKEESETK